MEIAKNMRTNAADIRIADCPYCAAEIPLTYGSQLYCGACRRHSRNPYAIQAAGISARCRDCGSWGPRDSRGWGWNCGCAGE